MGKSKDDRRSKDDKGAEKRFIVALGLKAEKWKSKKRRSAVAMGDDDDEGEETPVYAGLFWDKSQRVFLQLEDPFNHDISRIFLGKPYVAGVDLFSDTTLVMNMHQIGMNPPDAVLSPQYWYLNLEDWAAESKGNLAHICAGLRVVIGELFGKVPSMQIFWDQPCLQAIAKFIADTTKHDPKVSKDNFDAVRNVILRRAEFWITQFQNPLARDGKQVYVSELEFATRLLETVEPDIRAKCRFPYHHDKPGEGPPADGLPGGKRLREPPSASRASPDKRQKVDLAALPPVVGAAPLDHPPAYTPPAVAVVPGAQ